MNGGKETAQTKATSSNVFSFNRNNYDWLKGLSFPLRFWKQLPKGNQSSSTKCHSSVTTTTNNNKKRHCQQNNRPCCCETISHHSLRYLDRPETQYSHHALFSSEKLTWIPKCDVFCSIVGICKATCERICLTSGPVRRKWKCWKCVFVCRLRVQVEGFTKVLEISQEIIHHTRAGDGLRFCFICIHGGIINRQKWEQVSVVWVVVWTAAVLLDTFGVSFC